MAIIVWLGISLTHESRYHNDYDRFRITNCLILERTLYISDYITRFNLDYADRKLIRAFIYFLLCVTIVEVFIALIGGWLARRFASTARRTSES